MTDVAACAGRRRIGKEEGGASKRNVSRHVAKDPHPRARRLGDDTSVTGGLNRLDTRMMIVQHVPYKHNSTREMARRRGFLFLRRDARFSLTTRLAFPVRARAALVALG